MGTAGVPATAVAKYAGRVGVLTVDLTTFGIVMTADSQPVEALDGATRVIPQPRKELTRNSILMRKAGGFSGLIGFVGTEAIGGKATRDWLAAFGRRHEHEPLADYANALGAELTDEWTRLGLVSVLEILISGVEDGDVRFWFVRNSQGLHSRDWTYMAPKEAFDVVDDLDGRYMPKDLRPGQTKEDLLKERVYSFRQGVLLPAALVFDAFSEILNMLYQHGIEGFEPVASLTDLGYFARQRLEFVKRLYSEKHGIYRKPRAPLDGDVHAYGVGRDGVVWKYPKIRKQAKAVMAI